MGVHATQPCGACHKNNVYHGTPRTCYGCHKTNYDQTRESESRRRGLPYDVRHLSPGDRRRTGTRRNFNHAHVLALVGVHATQPCAACHKNNVYHGTPTHLRRRAIKPDYDADARSESRRRRVPYDVRHVPPGDRRELEPGDFNHSTFYQLVGVHATQPCVACHPNNRFAGTPTTCVGCHLDKYNATTNPNHVAAGFPTTCDTCHRPTDTSWNQGTFNHTWFPITSGQHANLQCAQCHTTPSNFAVFSCTTGGCHPQGETNGHHNGVQGYVYSSPACYSCHPNGRAGNLPTRLRPRV